jgi:cell division protein ZapA
MSEQIPVELRVLGHSFRLATTEAQQADLERAAQLLNEKYDEFRLKAPRMEPSKLIIMIALELMQDVLSLNKSVQEYEHCEILLDSLLQELEQYSQDKQLESKGA